MPRKINFQMVPLEEVPAKSAAPKLDARRSIILIVDDEVVIADTLAAILTRNGMLAMTAYDGETALDIARLIPPDLLLTDVVMPDMSGIDLAIAVSQDLPDCKILLFSGQASTMDLLVSAREDGHDFAVLTKPVHPGELLKRISHDLQSFPANHLNNGLKPSPPRPRAAL